MTKLRKIEWCCLKKDGIRIVDKNERVAKEYLASAEVDLLEMKKSSLKWKNIQAYYACYNSFYSLLVKIGVKCEIHDCSLELLDFFGFIEEDKELIKSLKKLRTNVQYYLKEPEEIDERSVAGFILKCKHVFGSLSFDEIKEIQQKILGVIIESNKKGKRGGGDDG